MKYQGSEGGRPEEVTCEMELALLGAWGETISLFQVSPTHVNVPTFYDMGPLTWGWHGGWGREITQSTKINCPHTLNCAHAPVCICVSL